MTRIAAIVATFVAVGGLLATYLWTSHGRGQHACAQGTVGGDIGGPFTLIDKTGREVTDADVLDKPALIYFGYTFCPDVCPFDVARNADAVDLLTEQGFDVRPIFITVDPQRDTPEVVGDYAEAMHDQMIGLTGSPEQIAQAAAAYRTYYQAHETEDEFYLVDHMAFTYLMMPETGFADFFRRDTSAEEMAERTACFLS